MDVVVMKVRNVGGDDGSTVKCATSTLYTQVHPRPVFVPKIIKELLWTLVAPMGIEGLYQTLQKKGLKPTPTDLTHLAQNAVFDVDALGAFYPFLFRLLVDNGKTPRQAGQSLGA
ncbi:hypothetical protein BGZ65_000050, partial [Modicella reniformis]